MVKRVHKSSDGLYHVNGGKFKGLVGSRAQVMHGTVYKTRGGLTKKKLKFNKHGKIVSRAKSSSNPLKRLTDAGYRTKKKVNLVHFMTVLMEDIEPVENLVNVEEQQKDVEQEKDVNVEQRRVDSVNVNPNLKYNYF